MAVQKIDYENKIGLQNDENVPNKNKVTDEDMNQIKSKVNNNADELSTAQQNIEDLQEGQGTASSEITSLENRVTTLEKDNTKNKQDIANKVDKVEGKGLSTEDYTTAEKEKLAGLKNYDDAEIKKDIQDLESDVSDIKSEQQVQNDLLERTQSALINITTEKSSNINVKDSSDLNAKIDVFGISEQETSTQGNNILDLNRPFLKGKRYNEQGIEEVDTRANTYSLKLEDGVNYFISIATGGSYYTKWKNNVFVSFEVKNPSVVQETKDSTFDEIRYSLFTDVDNFETSYINKNTNTGYEEFTPDMPSTKYPSDIENVTGNIDITVCNKNLFNAKSILNTSIITINDNQSITLQNNSVSNGNVSTGKTLKELCPCLGIGDTVFLNLITTNSMKLIYLYEKSNYMFYSNQSVKITEDMLNDIVYIYGGNDSKVDTLQIQITKNRLEDYEIHKEQLIPFPLAEGQKLYDGDYLADDGIHHKRKQIELDGTENWVVDNQASPSTCLGWKILVDDYVGYEGDFAPHGDILCSHFVDRNTYNNELDGISGGWGKWIFIKMKVEDLSSPDTTGFKAFLSQQKQAGTPVVVEYELAEEVIEPYTPDQQEAYNKLQNVLSYKTVTNVFTDKALLEFKYVADTETWVINEIKPLKEQISTINQLLSTTNTSALLLNNLQTDLESEVV